VGSDIEIGTGLPTVLSGFSVGPAGVPGFVTSGGQDKVKPFVEWGIDYYAASGTVMKFLGTYKQSGNSNEFQSSIKIAIPF